MFPGESTLNQLEKVIEVTGKPSKIDMKSIKSKHTQTMIDGLQVKPQRYDTSATRHHGRKAPRSDGGSRAQ